MRSAAVLLVVLACSSNTGAGDEATGGGVGQSPTGGVAAVGGTSAVSAANGGTLATGGTATVRHTGGNRGTGGAPGYPCAYVTYSCICSNGEQVIDETCPASTDPTNNLCARDLSQNGVDSGASQCTDTCSAVCKVTPGAICISVGPLICGH